MLHLSKMGAHTAVLPIYKWYRQKVPESLFCKSVQWIPTPTPELLWKKSTKAEPRCRSSSTANGTGWTSRNQGDNKLEAAGVGGYDTSAVVTSLDTIAKDDETVKMENAECEDGKYGEY